MVIERTGKETGEPKEDDDDDYVVARRRVSNLLSFIPCPWRTASTERSFITYSSSVHLPRVQLHPPTPLSLPTQSVVPEVAETEYSIE